MARHYVKDFSISRSKNGEHEYVVVEIKTEIAKKYKYAIFKDTRQPTLEWIEKLLDKGLSFAKQKKSKIEISEYLERSYVLFEFSKEAIEDLGYVNTQFTAVKVE
ncbi:hypothetical protein FXB85_05065 [Aggregatibacter actinomycetemcomitans]|uniref:hypothetical protein n=1 Tax=Aggregatibacter actinomycetemcomitans TaxID=714 RepID=UPI0011D38E2C|nr:hypothetical protein [Aggregatibacter actinomycetemcomitans]TYB21612.1 hypothetical protein FXB85_05065 [Aggregatibacter actinomycetemcomitans]